MRSLRSDRRPRVMTDPTTALACHLGRLEPSALAYGTRDRIGGSRIAALRHYLHTFAGGYCVVCGLPTRLDAARGASDYAEIGHLLPASTDADSFSRQGFVPGNVANMCHACNSAAGAYAFNACDVLAEYVPLEWPLLRAVKAGVDNHSAMAARIRAAKSLPF